MGSRYLAVALDMDGTTLSAARTLTDRTISTLRRVQAAFTRAQDRERPRWQAAQVHACRGASTED